ncbi:MAG: hypothetical protein WKF97_04050 [Chitinophagaceae bacterium]
MQPILQHLFKKNALQDIPVNEIEQCIHQYPFFPVGHFLMTKKLQATNDKAFHEQLQKTAIYFPNPIWLLYQLQQKEVISKASEPPLFDIKTMMTDSENAGAAVTSRDLIEDVVLHQETVFTIPEEASALRTTVPEDNATRSMAGSIHGVVDKMQTISAGGMENGGPVMIPQEPIPLVAFHTVDYFASQGIKITNEIQADDKLGKQLKSFTEWLKTMRRLPDVEEVIEKSNDKEVEQLAAHSLEEDEVITEAMAEVFIKQGKHQRAREVYHKLSLLNPHKIAYFAARIEALNLH